ncbi:hypothetical protein EVAR_66455_1 [Eumeta japonica]|uniref:Uncharacterized protein n=1 Tax=Eumeta variegata TaxID=151549 RepID=A0A4C1ZYH0_EUMVA|nr:hypothetical protein EVAR_66455_1 [Eumeta japonica]
MYEVLSASLPDPTFPQTFYIRLWDICREPPAVTSADRPPLIAVTADAVTTTGNSLVNLVARIESFSFVSKARNLISQPPPLTLRHSMIRLDERKQVEKQKAYIQK